MPLQAMDRAKVGQPFVSALPFHPGIQSKQAEIY